LRFHVIYGTVLLVLGGGRIDIGDLDADGLDVDRGMGFPFSFVGLTPVRKS
jgi:hypothetical protein